MKPTRCYSHDATSVDARARVGGLETPTTWFIAPKTNGMRPTGAPPH
jgi:hypothetical protein